MDQPAIRARYSSCNRERAPMRRGRPRRHEGPPCGGARRLTAALSRETRSGAGRRPRFVLPGDIPLHGEAPAADPSHDGSAQTGRLGRRDGRKRKVRGGRRAALFFSHKRLANNSHGSSVPTPPSRLCQCARRADRTAWADATCALMGDPRRSVRSPSVARGSPVLSARRLSVSGGRDRGGAHSGLCARAAGIRVRLPTAFAGVPSAGRLPARLTGGVVSAAGPTTPT